MSGAPIRSTPRRGGRLRRSEVLGDERQLKQVLLNLVANAKCIVAPEGSALFLCYFAPPGTRLLILENAAVEGANVWRAFFPECAPTAMAGTVVDRDEGFPHRSSYRIDPQRFRDFLGEWL